MGKTRKEEMTAKQLGVEFEVMKVDEREVYLGDIIGNDIEEEERFEERMKKMKKVAKRWKREDVGIYGRAIDCSEHVDDVKSEVQGRCKPYFRKSKKVC